MLIFGLLSGCLLNPDAYEQRKEQLTDHDGDAFAQENDCDDADAAVFPGADERCDGVDQDCDGAIDEDALDALTYYPDEDGDGYGVEAGSVAACEAPQAMVESATDCDDADADAHPGGTETPYDEVDQDCDGADLDDVDGDGWSATTVGGDDCDDADDTVFPGAAETWANGVTDNDCDGEIEAVQLDYGGMLGWGSRPEGKPADACQGSEMSQGMDLRTTWSARSTKVATFRLGVQFTLLKVDNRKVIWLRQTP